MIPSAAVAAAISLPVAAVATGRRTAFEALYCRASGLKLLVCTQTAMLAVARFCRRIFSAARAVYRPKPPLRAPAVFQPAALGLSASVPAVLTLPAPSARRFNLVQPNPFLRSRER